MSEQKIVTLLMPTEARAILKMLAGDGFYVVDEMENGLAKLRLIASGASQKGDREK